MVQSFMVLSECEYIVCGSPIIVGKQHHQPKAAASRTKLGEENIVVCEAMDGMGNPTMVAAVRCLELQF